MGLLMGAIGGLGKGMIESGREGIEKAKTEAEYARKESYLRLGIQEQEASALRVAKETSKIDSEKAKRIRADEYELLKSTAEERRAMAAADVKSATAAQAAATEAAASLYFANNLERTKKVEELKHTINRESKDADWTQLSENLGKLGLSPTDKKRAMAAVATGFDILKPEVVRGSGESAEKPLGIKDRMEMLQGYITEERAKIPPNELFSLTPDISEEQRDAIALRKGTQRYYQDLYLASASGQEDDRVKQKVTMTLSQGVSLAERGGWSQTKLRDWYYSKDGGGLSANYGNIVEPFVSTYTPTKGAMPGEHLMGSTHKTPKAPDKPWVPANFYAPGGKWTERLRQTP